ncbi:hypothetical protein [Streptomyces sp. NPDC002790]|uniref:hypothetical protein n=1 Tax=Streptomyces sp. NPDC002790 TaxID=3154431 RepID=UPI00331CB355
MEGTPIVVHPPLGTGARRVTTHRQIPGLAHSDDDVVEFLRRAGPEDADALLADPAWVMWRGGRAHHYKAA